MCSSFKEAPSWSRGLVAFALSFGLFIWWREGTQPALEYYTGYLIELSLSVDNLFVFILIFSVLRRAGRGRSRRSSNGASWARSSCGAS